jgi:hypothetical protein
VDPASLVSQDDARRRDLKRLLEILKLSGTGLPDLARMDPATRAEAEAILGRLGYMTAGTAADREQQKMLLGLARQEAQCRDLLEQGVPRWRKGKMLLDPQTGQPVRNLTEDRKLHASLRTVERLRFQLTGLPPAGDEPLAG